MGFILSSRMLGDPKFHQHRDVDPGIAEKWKTQHTVDFLGDLTWQVAESIGYNPLRSRPDSPRKIMERSINAPADA